MIKEIYRDFFYSFLHLLKRNILYISDKFKYGFDRFDIYDLDFQIAKFILPRLKLHRKITNSFPHNINSLEEWQTILDNIIFSFEYIIKIYSPKFDDFIDYNSQEHLQIEYKVNEGLRLFGLHFRNLWI